MRYRIMLEMDFHSESDAKIVADAIEAAAHEVCELIQEPMPDILLVPIFKEP